VLLLASLHLAAGPSLKKKNNNKKKTPTTTKTETKKKKRPRVDPRKTTPTPLAKKQQQ
jgi:hypothetical protein